MELLIFQVVPPITLPLPWLQVLAPPTVVTKALAPAELSVQAVFREEKLGINVLGRAEK